MGDTIIAGENESIGASEGFGVKIGQGATDSAGLLDAPTIPLAPASFDQFQSLTAANPVNFAASLKEGMELGTGAGSAGDREDIVKYAKKFLGVNYVWGGTSPSGFDCSGFTQYVARKFGVNLPRISADQARSGKRVDLGSLKAGDLVAWDNSSRNNGADHIAFYIGNGYIIEAPKPGAQVRIRKLGKGEGAWGVSINYPK